MLLHKTVLHDLINRKTNTFQLIVLKYQFPKKFGNL